MNRKQGRPLGSLKPIPGRQQKRRCTHQADFDDLLVNPEGSLRRISNPVNYCEHAINNQEHYSENVLGVTQAKRLNTLWSYFNLGEKTTKNIQNNLPSLKIKKDVNAWKSMDHPRLKHVFSGVQEILMKVFMAICGNSKDAAISAFDALE